MTQQVSALRAAGHEVELVPQFTDDRERRKAYPLGAAATVATGRGPDPLDMLNRFQPEIVHVHNLFPNFGRKWVVRWAGPIVATMHNFRPLCPAATFYRDGQVCTDCLLRRKAWPAVQHACYRGSRLRTLPLAVSTRFEADPLLRRANRIVVLNEKMAQLYAQAGVGRDRIVRVPNFLADAPPAGIGGNAWLYVGRLSPEKGILELLAEWPSGQRLRIVGDGPLLDKARAMAPLGVSVLGRQPPQRVGQLLRDSIGLVFPSRWFEGFPMVYLEALASGTPVLAWPVSAVAGMVREQGTGRIAGELVSSLELAAREFPSLRAHCRSVFESRFTEQAWLGAIRSVYLDSIVVSDASHQSRR